MKKYRIYLHSINNIILSNFLGAVIVTIATVILFAFRERLNTSTVALLYLLPVLISTTLWGLGPGILAAFLTFLSYNYFFLLPYYTFVVHESQDIFALGIFLVVAILISQLVGRAKKGMEAALDREQEATRLYELSTGLTGLNDFIEIGEVIAHQTIEAFQAEAVEITVENVFGERSFMVREGGCDVVDRRNPVAVMELKTIRGLLGEIRFWRDEKSLTPIEFRLLHTFAAQGALALERAALAHAETRAKVLEESDRLKSSLLSSVSHEFRTPLATIKAATTSLLSKQLSLESDARNELLAAIDEEADQLNHLVGNLLDMSRIESGALKPNRQWNLVSEIVDDAIVQLRRELVNHHLRVEIPEDLPLIPVDYIQIRQVLTNLLSNSSKYAPKGSEILIRALVSNQNDLLVQVTNQGPPVGSEHIKRIFDKFYRVTDAEKVSGTGLGLSICKGIVEAHGGKIWAENLNAGFTFCFTLPLAWDGTLPPVVESDEP